MQFRVAPKDQQVFHAGISAFYIPEAIQRLGISDFI
jgi:hypothetical protein